MLNLFKKKEVTEVVIHEPLERDLLADLDSYTVAELNLETLAYSLGGKREEKPEVEVKIPYRYISSRDRKVMAFRDDSRYSLDEGPIG